MTHITLPRAVVEQALEALEAFLSDELRPYEAAKISDALRAALAQQAEPTPPDAAAGLVDDLCLLQLGWVSDAEGVLHRAAMGRVIARAAEVRRLRLIEQLKAQVAQMEGNT